MKRILTLLTAIVLCLQFNFVTVFAAEPPATKAESAILIYQETGKILYGKNIHDKMYPASTTKMLTALLAIENLKSDEMITVGDEIDRIGLDSSTSGLYKGETLTVENLLWALLLPSGNDAAYTFAVNVARKKSGNPSMSIQEAISYFTELMNKRAKELGAKDSNFVNPDGYHDENHYSSAYDLSLIAREALKNDLFKKIVSTRIYTKPENGKVIKKDELPWVNRNELISKYSKYYYEFATGVKTGHTSQAGYCLVSSATKGGSDLIAVVMKEPVQEAIWTDSKALLEYGFSNFSEHTILQKGQVINTVTVGKKHRSEIENLEVISDKEYTDILNNDDVANIKQDFKWNKDLISPENNNSGDMKLLGPISEGQIVGTVTYTLDGKPLVEANLLASKSVMKKDFLDTLISIGESIMAARYIIISALAVIIFAFVIMKVLGSRKNKKTRSRY